MKFSLRYPDDGPPTLDGIRFRNRLASYIGAKIDGKLRTGTDLVSFLERETGAILDGGNFVTQVENLFRKGELRDVRDAVTHIYEWLGHRGLGPEGWRDFVVRVLKEENIGYIIDDEGAVQYLVDEAFQVNRATTLSSHQTLNHGAVRAAFEDAHRHFNTDDTKAAVRSMYEALEILAKIIKPSAPRLTEQLVYDLRDLYANRYDSADQAARTAHNALFAGMADWVKGLQVYRHGQGSEKVIAPDESMCVHILSTGATYIRWLVDLENKSPRS